MIFHFLVQQEESTRLRESAKGNMNQQLGGDCMCLFIIIIL